MSFEDCSCLELWFTQAFQCVERGSGAEAYGNDGGLLTLHAELWRGSFSTDGMNGEFGVSLELRGDVNEHSSFLTSG